MRRRFTVPLVLLVLLAACDATPATATSQPATTTASTVPVAPTAQDLQSELARLDVDFASVGPGTPAAARGDAVDRASRGSGLLTRHATWVYSGELTAQATQGRALVDRSVWAVYFSGIEQPLMGGPGTAVSDWVVFVDTGTDNVVLAVTVALTVRDST